MLDLNDPRFMRRPPRIEKQEKTFGEKLIAQWPGFAGLLLMVFGALAYLAFRHTSGYLATRIPAVFFAFGIASIGYWALANRNDDYTSM